MIVSPIGRYTARLAAAGALTLALCGGAAAETTLRAVMHSDLKILDPVWSGTQIVRSHAYMVYDTLFALDAALKPQPQMVDKWEVSPDKLTYTFTLRDGLEWHDGKPVTAEDCIASLKRWAARDAMGQKLLDYTKELIPVEARTIRLVLKEPYGLVLESLAKPGGTAPFMMPKRVADTPASQQFTDPTGSGPFIFKADEWKPGSKVVYVRNPKYKPRAEPASGLGGGKVVKVDRVEWIAMTDQQTAVNALLSGEIDVIEQVSHDLIPLVEPEKSITLQRTALSNQFSLRLNWLHPPLDNPKIREAIGYALEQTDFLQASIGDKRYYRPCKTYFVCDTPFATTAGADGRLEGNAKKAQEMLKEAGYDGTPVVLMQSTDLAVLTNLAPVAKAQLERAGFKIDMQSMDWQTLVSRRVRKEPPAQGGWHLFITSWGSLDLLDPVTMQFLNASCDKSVQGWPCDARIEELRDQFAREADPAKRKAVVDELQTRALTLGTHFPLGEWYGVAALSTKVKNWPKAPSTVFWSVEKTP